MVYVSWGILGIAILFVAIFALLLVLMFFTALIEKQYVSLFKNGTIVGLGKYHDNRRQQAEDIGFKFITSGRNTRDKPVSASLLLSPDNQTIAMIINGKELGIQVKRTILISQCRDQSFLFTADQLSDGEMDPMTYRSILKDASFNALFQLHQQRILNRGTANPFADNASWKTVEEIYQMRANRAARAGIIRFADIQGSSYRYTLKGALRLIGTFMNFVSHAAGEAERRRNAQLPDL